MSLPSSSAEKPAAIAAAAPPEEPPGVCARFHGFDVAPYTGLKLCQSARLTGTLVLPNTTAPAAVRRCTASASSWAALLRCSS